MASQTILPTNYTTLIQVGAGGVTQHTYTVPRLEGSAFQTSGLGEITVTTMTGTRGVLDVTFVTGTAGTARAVAFLVDASGTRYAGIAVDTRNRAYGVMSVDGSGTVLAKSFGMGATLPAGVQVRARLVFDSTAAVEGTSFVAVSVDGLVSNMQTACTSAWTPFRPATLHLGDGASLAAFNGQQAPFVQLSEQVDSSALTTRVVGRTASIGAALDLTATAAYAAAAPTMELGGAVDLSADATFGSHLLNTIWEARFDRLALSTGLNGAEAAAFLTTRHLGFTRLSTASIEVAPATFVSVAVDEAGIGDDGNGRGLVIMPGDGGTRVAERVWYDGGPSLAPDGRCELLIEFVAAASSAAEAPVTPYFFNQWGDIGGIECWMDEAQAVTIGQYGWGADIGYETTTVSMSYAAGDQVSMFFQFGGGATTVHYSVNGGAWVNLDPGSALTAWGAIPPAQMAEPFYFLTYPHALTDPDYTLRARIQNLAALMPGEGPV